MLEILSGVAVIVVVVLVFVFASDVIPKGASDPGPVVEVAATDIEKQGVGTEGRMLFELESGQRVSYRVSGEPFLLHVVGDSGTLTMQGKRFISFAS